MPLSRFQVRNEYGLGVRELYSEASKKEDPKAVLNGVAVAGLVGLLRQLGDLTEFAAEVFHGLQEEITITTSRSQKMMSRVKHIEITLPAHEKAMLSQTSHIHFAYTPGTEWHPRIVIEQNLFIYTDMPRCIGDLYEECKEPPRLQLLDRFDTGGLGSCLKRYSDPTFFRKALANSSSLNDEKSKKERKAHNVKKRRSWKQRSSLLSRDTSNTRVQISSPPRRHHPSATKTVSAFNMTFKSDLVDRSRSDSHGSGDGMDFIECVFRPNTSLQTDETKSKQSLSGSGDMVSTLESKYPGKQTLISSDDSPRSSTVEENGQASFTDTWNEEAENEICSELGRQHTEQAVWMSWNDVDREVHEPGFEFYEPNMDPTLRSSEVPELLETNYRACDPDIGSVDQVSSRSEEMEDKHEKSFQSNDLYMEHWNENYEGNEKLEVHETNLQYGEQNIDGSHNPTGPSLEGMDSPSLNLPKNELDEVESETDNFVDALNSIESEPENDLDCRFRVDNERVSDKIHGESPSVPCDELDLCGSASLQDVPAGIIFTKDNKRERISGFPCVSEQPFVTSSNVNPVAMWTNGILLGLQPSKPPDLGNSSGNGHKNIITAGNLNQNLRREDYSYANGSRHEHGSGNAVQSKPPSFVDVRDTSNEEAEHVNDSRSSFLTSDGRGLLKNSFQRTRSMEHYNVPETFGHEKSHEFENSPHVTSVRKEVPAPIESAPPSPSLEHMKISFQPIKSLGTSTLKLKYPEGINHLDEISDAFPSFQLVPEPTLQDGNEVDSDDDTFCRSIPYISDDEITHLSDSNSEMWESGDSSESSRNHTSHIRPCRSSSGESVSSLAERKEKEDTHINNIVESSVNPFGFQETKITLNPLAPISPFDFGELNLEPPPLPPIQWRTLRPQSDTLVDKRPGSGFPHLAKPATEDLIHRATEHVNVTANNKQSVEQNLKATAKKRFNQAGSFGRVDDRDDFLQQIRTKSFNLRKTGLLQTALSPTPAPPPPCVKVTAILEKAKTIRQAVASDDGEEDDPWSDT